MESEKVGLHPGISNVADPVGVDPDPYSILERKPDPNPTLEKTSGSVLQKNQEPRFRIQQSGSDLIGF